MDVDNVRPGQDWADAIDAAVSKSDVVLVIIGKGWAAAADENGNRRLDDPADPVRLEIESALQHGKQIIPILFEQADLPAEADLPESIRPLRRRQVQKISHATFQSDISPLVRELRALRDAKGGEASPVGSSPPLEVRGSGQAAGGRSSNRNRWIVVGAAGIAVLVLAAIVIAPSIAGFFGGAASPAPSAASSAASSAGGDPTSSPATGSGEVTTRLAWIEGSGLDGTLYTQNLSGTSPIGSPVARYVGGSEPAWDPSGRFVVLTSQDTGNPDRLHSLIVVDTSTPGNPPFEIPIDTPPLAQIGQPAFAPDGKSIAFWGTTDPNGGGEQNVYIATHPQLLELLSGSPAASPGDLDVCPIAAVDEAFPRSLPAWSFSGTGLAFHQGRESDLMQVDPACDAVPNPISLPLDSSVAGWESLAWQVDGSSLVGGGLLVNTDDYELWSITLDGQLSELPPTEGEFHYGVATSARHMAYVVEDGSTFRLWIVDVANGANGPVRQQQAPIQLDSPSLVEVDGAS